MVADIGAERFSRKEDVEQSCNIENAGLLLTAAGPSFAFRY